MGFAACALFAAFWAASAIATLPMAYDDAGYAVIAPITAALFGAPVQLIVRSSQPAAGDPAARARRRRTALRFWLIFAAEVIATRTSRHRGLGAIDGRGC